MGPVHEPSPSKGEVKPVIKKLAPNVGPMVCVHSANSIQHTGFHSNPALTAFCYKKFFWHSLIGNQY